MALNAYALREEYAGTVDQIDADGNSTEVPVFTGGLITIGDGRELDVRVALDENGGTIVVTDTAVSAVAALDTYPALKSVPVPAGAEPIITPHDGKDLADLRRELTTRNIGGGARATRARVIAALVAADDLLASGVAPSAPLTVGSLVKGAANDEPADDPPDDDPPSGGPSTTTNQED